MCLPQRFPHPSPPEAESWSLSHHPLEAELQERKRREGETLVKTNNKKCSKISSSLDNYVVDSCLLTDILKRQYMLSGTGSLDNYVVSQTVNLIS